MVNNFTIPYKELFENIDTGIAFCLFDGKLLDANIFLCNLLGYTKKELKEKTLFDLTISENKEIIAEKLLQAKQRSQTKLHFELILQRKDKSLIWLLLHISALSAQDNDTDYYSIVFKSISEQKNPKKIEVENDLNLSLFFHKAPLLMAISTLENGRYVGVNEEFLKKTGYAREEIIGKTAVELGLISNQERNQLMDILFATGELKSIEAKLTKKDKTHLNCLYSGELVELKGRKYLLSMAQDITQRKKYEEESRQNLELFTNIFELSPLPVSLSRIDDSRYINLNNEWCRFFGFKLDEAIGKSMIELGMIKQEANEKIREAFRKKGYIKNMAAVITTKKGELKNMLSSVESITLHGEKYALNILVDITEQVKAQKELQNEKKRLLKMADSVPGALCSFRIGNDNSYQMPYASPHITDVLGFTPAELSKNAIHLAGLVYHEDNQRVAEAVLESARTLSQYHCEYRFQHPQKGLIWLEVYSTPIREEDGGTMWHGIINDITQRKKSDDLIIQKSNEYQSLSEEYLSLNEELIKSLERVNEINIELEKARKKAEESDRLKSVFLANMSHEVRTPLNAIIGFSGLIGKEDLEEQKREKFIDIIQNSGKRLSQIIDDIIDVSKIESGQISMIIQEYNVYDIIHGSLQIFNNNQLFLNKPDLKMKLNFPEAYKNIVVKTDVVRLNQVLENLISNAIKYTTKGLIEVGVKKFDDKARSELEVYVKDSGRGIPKEKFNIIFERFRQVEEYEYHEGAGLGLSISKGIVQILGGRIWFESELGQGSTFYFTIPINNSQISKKQIRLKKK